MEMGERQTTTWRVTAIEELDPPRIARETAQLLAETHPTLHPRVPRSVPVSTGPLWPMLQAAPTGNHGTRTTDAQTAASLPAPSPTPTDRSGAPTDGTTPTAGPGGGAKIPDTLHELRERIGLPIGGPDVDQPKDRQREMLDPWTRGPLHPSRHLQMSRLSWMTKEGVQHLMPSAPHLVSLGWWELTQNQFMSLARRDLILMERSPDKTKERLLLKVPLPKPFGPDESTS